MENDSGKRDGLAGAAVESAARLEGAASLMRLFEEEGETAAETAAVRWVVEPYARALDAAWHQG